jgi:NAD(P)-dependent dehydrogenase (short-subunit alcohol dehydrogenase family)
VNLLGTVIGIKHAAKAMIPAKQGVIISTSSIAGSIAKHSSYNCSNL